MNDAPPKRQFWLLAAIAVVLVAAIGIATLQLQQARTPVGQVTREIRTRVQRKDFRLRAYDRREAARTWDLMRQFYRKRGYRTAWTNGRGPEPQARQLLEAVGQAGRDGLDPGDYDYNGLLASMKELEPGLLEKPPSARELADFDLRMTWTFSRYGYHLLNGRVARQAIDPDWVTNPRRYDLMGRLDRATRQHQVKQLLGELLPHDPAYARLRDAAARYAEIVSHGGWPALGTARGLRPGQRGTQVTRLERRLAIEGDLSDTTAHPVLDDRMRRAIGRFQARHGLEPTGAVDGATLAALDVPAGVRVRQIQLNLERWRWLPSDLGSRYVAINIPEFQLSLVENRRPELTMKVVVGKVTWPTPVFSDRITHIELNPYWNIPPSIAEAEIIPAAEEDPDYLARSHIQMVGESYRQDPGPDNPLGRVKFMMPNEYDVYLHDTPAGHLFDQRERGFSHGCIRLERPMELADYLMRGSRKWSEAQVHEIVESGENKVIPLPEAVPVHILYWTTWADPDGAVQFRDDVYGVDSRLDWAIRRGRVSNFRLNVGGTRASA